VASPSELKSKLTSKLQKPFQEAVNRRLADGGMPPGVGWILINKAKKLFLLSDLHVGPEQAPVFGESRADSLFGTQYSVLGTQYTESPAAGGEAPRCVPEAGHSDFASAFNDAFAKLDRQAGGHNFVSLVALRSAVPRAREEFDAELRALRLAGRFTLSAAEGRHGLTAAEQEAGILENGTLLLYVSLKSP
jgi:hypothetical protein